MDGNEPAHVKTNEMKTKDDEITVLVYGKPKSGKTTLIKMIAETLHAKLSDQQRGGIENRILKDKTIRFRESIKPHGFSWDVGSFGPTTTKNA